jgi:Flp pilus assembly pilin Flp
MQKLRNVVQALAVRIDLARGESGQALIEYALIISLIALVAITALQTTGTDISSILNTIAGEV